MFGLRLIEAQQTTLSEKKYENEQYYHIMYTQKDAIFWLGKQLIVYEKQ